MKLFEYLGGSASGMQELHPAAEMISVGLLLASYLIFEKYDPLVAFKLVGLVYLLNAGLVFAEYIGNLDDENMRYFKPFRMR